MSSRTSTQVCDYCQQKAKFSGHQYCSKTCAKQAASLCNHCHKKPKFGTFEFCGKNCAAAAAASTGGNPRNPASNTTTQPQAPAKGTGQAKGNGIAAPQKPSKPFNPVPQMVAQQLPQGQNPPAAAVPAQPAAAVIPPQPPVSNAPANPFVKLVNKFSSNGASAVSSNSASANQLPDDEELECLIPGCGQPVHVDADGFKTSDYCSMRHREEAVTSGLVSPCIMCLTLPQSGTDYFCGRACREEALAKPLGT